MSLIKDLDNVAAGKKPYRIFSIKLHEEHIDISVSDIKFSTVED